MAELSATRHATVLSLRAREAARDRGARALGLAALPGVNETADCTGGTCLWVRPDEWLVIGEPSARDSLLGALEAVVGMDDGAVIDISASRVLFELTGARARDVLASCCPLDLHPRAFAVGQCAQSVVGKAPILLQLLDDSPRWRIVVRPTLVDYVTSWLTDAIAGA